MASWLSKKAEQELDNTTPEGVVLSKKEEQEKSN
jgi:hypothetical protein